MNDVKKLSDYGVAVVRVSTTTPKGSYGDYGRCALMVVDGSEGRYVSMISLRARGVKEIVRVSPKLYWGKTANSALATRIASMRVCADEINDRTFRDMSRAAFAS